MEYTGWERDFPISKYLTAKAARNKIPLHGAFELTARCNFNCRMCYIHDINSMNELKERELPVSWWLKTAEEARKEGLLFLLLTGGEAMLREDFRELYQELAQMGFRLVINTNGSLIDEKILELFRKYPPGRVNVSMYGASEETYKRLCGREMKERAARGIRELKKIGLSVRTTMTPTPYNCQDMKKVYDFSRQENTLFETTSYTFPPARREGQMTQPDRMTAQEAGKYMVQRDKMILSSAAFYERAAKMTDYCKENKTEERTENDTGAGVSCQAGNSSFWITWEGKMRPCGLMTAPEADVVRSGFSQAWKQIYQATEQIRMPVECKYCSKKRLCRVCAAMCQTETGSFDKKPEYVCQMAEAMLEEYRKEAGREE